MSFLTVSQYAALTGVTRQAVLARIKRGTLKGRRMGHFWTVEVSQSSRTGRKEGDGK